MNAVLRLGRFACVLLGLVAVVGVSLGARGDVPPPSPAVAGPGTMGPRQPGSVVYPTQHLALRFNHSEHLVRGIDCAQCHKSAAMSRRVRDNILPRGEACDACHGFQHPLARDETPRCTMCHVGADDTRRSTSRPHAPPARLVFSHQMHTQRKIPCGRCHGDMSTVRLATVLQLPREQTCLECHDGRQASSTCSACHPADARGKLITREEHRPYSAPLVPRGASGWGMVHDLAFVEDHAGAAKANADACLSCHHDNDCQECHNGSIRPLRIHNGDYLSTHALDARARALDCQACHRVSTDCRGCHERLGIKSGQDGKFGVGSPLRFHPDGWSGPPGQPQAHAFAAQHNIGACASCHDEDVCLSCHATARGPMPGLNVSPHGRSFAGSIRCQTLARRNHRVCLKCHEPGSPHNDCRG